MREKYLPIGSVVMLKGAEVPLMVTGFCPAPLENPRYAYDYCGCIYPFGFLTPDTIAMFNHDQIEEILFVGFENENEAAFKKDMIDILKENNLETGKKPEESIMIDARDYVEENMIESSPVVESVTAPTETLSPNIVTPETNEDALSPLSVLEEYVLDKKDVIETLDL